MISERDGGLSRVLFRAVMRRKYIPWVIWAIGSLLIALLVQAAIPTSKRLTGPLACPAGTAHYVVHRYMTRGSNNKTSDTSDLVCIDADGGGTRANALLVMGTGFGFTGTLFGIPLVVFGLRGRRKERAS